VDLILAPDVYVNASVAPGTFPDRVVQRVLGKHKGQCPATEWVLARVETMLSTLPAFKPDAVKQQVSLIRSLVNVIPGASDFPAKASNAQRVVTDHPDLLAKESSDGIEFVSSEAWLFEVTQPPPVPPTK
jgi:hypothetical protein